MASSQGWFNVYSALCAWKSHTGFVDWSAFWVFFCTPGKTSIFLIVLSVLHPIAKDKREQDVIYKFSLSLSRNFTDFNDIDARFSAGNMQPSPSHTSEDIR